MKIKKSELRRIIAEEKARLQKESVTDMTPMDNLIADHAGQIVNAFGQAMSSLWDEDTAMMKQQGYTNRSEWDAQVGGAEVKLEDALQDAINKTIQRIEAELHDGAFYRGSR